MSPPTDRLISAQVLLMTSNRRVPREADLVAGRIADMRPSPKTIAEVTAVFGHAGFEVGPVVGVTFSISGPQSRFDEFFGQPGLGATPGEVPRRRIPVSLQGKVAAIMFQRPPESGLGSFG